ncbi:LOW QUALITY PROTEIN: hypothetical protein BRADI_4g29752v3 [Brachypodium distachyon]|uniref:Uncharacterized protein n=1 Tax=Brachypodium distachyon TaxID=15368 RepID=A0A2K2CR66_BRADI|nr:LOW QUALITY PROTEIN: hypothetical protein BRADI_4g29752v3 [Brachypodium distachyon]
MDRRASLVVPSICIQIPEHLQLPTKLFEPQMAIQTPRTARSSGADEHDAAPPERQLTALAMQLAVFEKVPPRHLAFIWATVVLLDGFAVTLSRTDFWCITVLLLTEGARIQGRSHELVWQQKATPASQQAVSRVLHWLQLLSASFCVTLSLARLVQLQLPYGGSSEDPWSNNCRAALDIFYGLALTESLLFLVEKALWQWRVGHRRLLECVAKDCHLGTAWVAVRRFFYDSYSRSLKGSIFDGLHMDLVSYAGGMLTAGSHDDQSLTLRKIGMSVSTIERLIQMLSWNNASERDVRRSAAVVVSMLSGRKLIALRVTGIPGAIESIASLLCADLDELNLLGLSILNKLAHDHDNCSKIGKTQNLLDKIISFSSVGGSGHQATDIRLKAAKQSLIMVKRLAGSTGTTGKLLRRDLSDIVFTMSNVREVLQQTERRVQSELHQPAIEVLTSLAMDKEAREMIGWTGGVVSELVTLFLPAADQGRPTGNNKTNAIRVEAGEALAMLALESRRNCGAIIMACGGGVERLVDVTSITETELAETLLQILGEYNHPSMVVPRIRRHTIEFAVAMMRLDSRYMALFVEHGMEGELRRIAGTTSDLECFNVFSGSVGLNRRAISVCSLVTSALDLMKQA